MTDLDQVLARLTALEAEVADLRAENDRLRTQPPAPTEAATTGDGTVGRRSLITKGLAAAGAATAGAVLLGAEPAAAANGQALVIGGNNSGTTATRLNVTAPGTDGGVQIIDSGGLPNLFGRKPGLVVNASGGPLDQGIVVESTDLGLDLRTGSEAVRITTAPGDTTDAAVVVNASEQAMNLLAYGNGPALFVTSRTTAAPTSETAGISADGHVAIRAIGTAINGAASSTIGIDARSTSGTGVKASSTNARGVDATGGTFAVYGFGQKVGVYGGAPTFTGDTNVGVQGNARTGVNGQASVATGVGVLAENRLGTASRATGEVAAELIGTETHLRLSNPAGFRALPKDDTFAHQVGDIVTDGYGNLWYCNTSGTPGTWRSISGPTCVGAFFPSAAPIRAYDSRPGTSPTNPGPKTKLAAGATRIINLRTSGAANANATAVLVQVLLVNAAAGNGNFTIWSGGVAKPLANTLVWGGTSGRFSTLAFTTVDANGNVQVNASLSTDLVLDVIGIYG